MIHLEARNLSRALELPSGKVVALRDFSAQFMAQRRYAICGPSGCGKSTLLYLLGLLDRPTSGEVLIKGQATAGLLAQELCGLRNRSLGFVFQFHLLLPELTALENVMLPGLKAQMLPQEAEEKAFALLKEVGLEAKARRLANQLSGGEQQRVAVARALINTPAVVLADEPTGNLDAANSRVVFDLLGRACLERGSTLILVTHNPELSGQCDEVLRLADGNRVS